LNLTGIAVFGPGLLGGSVALAVKEKLPQATVRLWARREEACAHLLDLGFDATTRLGAALQGADLIVLATPIGIMPELAASLVKSGHLQPGAVITDVGSVKGPVVAELTPVFAKAGAVFVGSHPMAGSEKTGIEHARALLFNGARCIVTPREDTPPDAVRLVQDFWQRLGCHTAILAPEVHDSVVARISHLPHAAAAAIVLAALGKDISPLTFSGGGFRDTTRVAAGAPEMWAEILLENRAEVSASLEDLRQQLVEMLEFLRNGDQEKLAACLKQAKELRDQLGGSQAGW